MKFHILVFGCQMNYADAARVKAVMRNCGFEYSETVEDAEIILFDTCSVKQKAEDKITGRLQDISSDKKIWITGCMVQHNLRNSKIANNFDNKKISGLMAKGNFVGTIKDTIPQIIGFNNEEIKHPSEETKSGSKLFINHAFNPLFVNLQKKFKNLELLFRIDDVGFLPIILPKLGYKIATTTESTNEYSTIIPNFQGENQEYENPSTAYIPISTGCNQFCSFCIVPYARGLEKHFPVDQIIQEAKEHIANGAKEITLLGQIVNKHPEFTMIIKEVLKLPGVERLRYTSPYPSYYNQELFNLHETEPKLCPHIHIPVQSGSNNILKKMFRGYSVETFKTFIDQIQSLKRDISITTDIIVGFPGETEEDFAETLALVKYAKFDMIYIGIYSPRKGTHADQKLEDTIPYAEKHRRRDKLNTLLTEISLTSNQAEIGLTKKILINRIIPTTNGFLIQGHTDNMKTVEWESKEKEEKGRFVEKKITATQSLKLFAS